jgi:hypothetical protein
MASSTVAIPAKSDESASFQERARAWEKSEYYPLDQQGLEKNILERRIEGRIGRYTAAYLDELLADHETMLGADEDIYYGGAVWDTLDALRWWLKTIYDVSCTRSAMALADLENGQCHPLQTILIAEAGAVFALSSAAIPEQIRTGYLLVGEPQGLGTDCNKDCDYDPDFPHTAEFIRAYRVFAKRAAATCVTIFPGLTGKIEDVI